MTKTYKTPMLYVVSISKNNIIATSNIAIYDDVSFGDELQIEAPGRRFDSWNEGY